MKKEKKRRLEAAGWMVGTAEEFLDLTPEEQAFLNAKIALAGAIRAWRSSRSMTQIDVARLVQSSQSRVAKMEAADPTVSIDLLVRTLLSLGAPLTELGRTIGNANADRPN
ncbi:MAG: transcriptional regulator [Gemmatimonadetes bacterium]|nr:transcriptional regulator [Gemmatimonadota bacterium]